MTSTGEKSNYDPTRPTVGKIYRDIHLNSNQLPIETGDMTNMMMPHLVQDINEALEAGSREFGGRPFYLLIHEKKDLQMKDTLLRRMIKQLWRPYPEDDTTVFWHNPKLPETRFCWCLPHWSEMANMINNKEFFDHNLISQIMAWRRLDLHPFGFTKGDMGQWIPNKFYKDKPLTSKACT